jgi:hypothetical protein
MTATFKQYEALAEAIGMVLVPGNIDYTGADLGIKAIKAIEELGWYLTPPEEEE